MLLRILLASTKDICLPGSTECVKNVMRTCDINGRWTYVDCPSNTECRIEEGTVSCGLINKEESDPDGLDYYKNKRTKRKSRDSSADQVNENSGDKDDDGTENYPRKRRADRSIQRDGKGNKRGTKKGSDDNTNADDSESRMDEEPEKTSRNFKTVTVTKSSGKRKTKTVTVSSSDPQMKNNYITIVSTITQKTAPREIKLEYTTPNGVPHRINMPQTSGSSYGYPNSGENSNYSNLSPDGDNQANNSQGSNSPMSNSQGSNSTGANSTGANSTGANSTGSNSIGNNSIGNDNSPMSNSGGSNSLGGNGQGANNNLGDSSSSNMTGSSGNPSSSDPSTNQNTGSSTAPSMGDNTGTGGNSPGSTSNLNAPTNNIPGSTNKPSGQSNSGGSNTNSSSSGSSNSSSSSSGSSSSNSSGGIISQNQLVAAMKAMNFNPKNEYVQAVIKKTNEKFKDKEMAAMFLAQLAHESGGFQFIEEIACAGGTKCAGQYGTGAPGKSYHGRGFIQLSWPENYKNAGAALGMGNKLYDSPEMVAKDPNLGMDVSIWFWQKNVETKPGVKEKKQFGLTTKAINGELECKNNNNKDKSKKRYEIYKVLCKEMGIKNPASESGCYT